MADEFESLVTELFKANRELWFLQFDDENPQTLGPPASPAEIASLERLFGRPLPRSYRTFLEHHNGWVRFDGDGNLLSIAEQTSGKVKERIEEMNDHFDHEDVGRDPFRAGCLPVLLGWQIRNYAVLDPRTVRADGEMDVVTFELVDEENRFPDFGEYLRYCLKVTLRVIEKQKNGTVHEDEG